MNAERKAEWVAALRSGDYKKTTGRLSSIDADGNMAHCCLGVACQLAVEAGVIPPPKMKNSDLTYIDSNATLPERVQDWLDLPSDNGELRWNGVRTSLTELNDGIYTEKHYIPEHSFDCIADVIERRF